MRCGELGGGDLAGCQTGECQHGDVVVLAKVHGGLGGLFGVRELRHQGIQALKAEDLAIGSAGLQQAIGVEGHAVSFADAQGFLLVNRVSDHAERNGAWEFDLRLVEVGRRVAGAGHHALADGADAHGQTGGEAVLHAAVEASIQLGQDFGRLRGVARHGARRAHNHGDGHGRLQALAAYVAQQDESAAFVFSFQRNDLEEVAADFLCRPVGAGHGKAGQGWQLVGDQHLLQLAGALVLLLQRALAVAVVTGRTEDCVEDGEKECQAQQ